MGGSQFLGPGVGVGVGVGCGFGVGWGFGGGPVGIAGLGAGALRDFTYGSYASPQQSPLRDVAAGGGCGIGVGMGWGYGLAFGAHYIDTSPVFEETKKRKLNPLQQLQRALQRLVGAQRQGSQKEF